MENKTESLIVKDSGKRQDFETGSKRDLSNGKIRPDLIPSVIEFYDSALLAMGAIKYGENNWTKGQPIMRYYESLKRHTMYFALGAIDENHLAAIRWNTMGIQYTLLMIKHGLLPAELDDRPEYMKPGNAIGAELLETFKMQSEETLRRLEEMKRKEAAA